MPTVDVDELNARQLTAAGQDLMQLLVSLNDQLAQVRLRQQRIARRAIQLGVEADIARVLKVNVARVQQLADLADLADRRR